MHHYYLYKMHSFRKHDMELQDDPASAPRPNHPSQIAGEEHKQHDALLQLSYIQLEVRMSNRHVERSEQIRDADHVQMSARVRHAQADVIRHVVEHGYANQKRVRNT